MQVARAWPDRCLRTHCSQEERDRGRKLCKKERDATRDWSKERRERELQRDSGAWLKDLQVMAPSPASRTIVLPRHRSGLLPQIVTVDATQSDSGSAHSEALMDFCSPETTPNTSPRAPGTPDVNSPEVRSRISRRDQMPELSSSLSTIDDLAPQLNDSPAAAAPSKCMTRSRSWPRRDCQASQQS